MMIVDSVVSVYGVLKNQSRSDDRMMRKKNARRFLGTNLRTGPTYQRYQPYLLIFFTRILEMARNYKICFLFNLQHVLLQVEIKCDDPHFRHS